MSRPGDWSCRSCQHKNFGWRDMCQKCSDSRSTDACEYGNLGDNCTYQLSGSVLLPGDWYCSARNCGAHNYASRPSCFKCSKLKDESADLYESVLPCTRGSIGRSGWKPGDWICPRPGCSEHNFAARAECFRCNAPKDYGSNY